MTLHHVTHHVTMITCLFIVQKKNENENEKKIKEKENQIKKNR